MKTTGLVTVQRAGTTTRAAVEPLLTRIISSPGFSNSPRLSRLLQYLVEHSLAGDDRELQEYAVGMEVFDRGPEFDPHSDTIVRVTARRLRKRLGEYYDGPGQEESLVLAMPKGHYRVEFQVRRHPLRRFEAPIAVCIALVGIAVYLGLPDSEPASVVNGEIQSNLPPVAIAAQSPSGSQAAVELGRHLFSRRGPGDVERALDKFNRALAIDPELVDAWVGIAGCLKILAHEGSIDFDQSLARQHTVLSAALRIDPQHAEANMRMAYVYWAQGDDENKMKYRSRALEAGNDNALVQSIAAGMLQRAGDHGQAIAFQRRAVELNPLSFVNQSNLGHLLYQNFQLEEALGPLGEARTLSPEMGHETDADIARVLILLERHTEAGELAAKLPPGADRDQLYSLMTPAQQLGEEASDALTSLEARPGPEPAIRLAEVYAFIGETDRALLQLAASRALIEQAWERELNREHQLERLIFSPYLQPLHSDPRWYEFWHSTSLAHLVADERPSGFGVRGFGVRVETQQVW